VNQTRNKLPPVDASTPKDAPPGMRVQSLFDLHEKNGKKQKKGERGNANNIGSIDPSKSQASQSAYL